MVLSFTATVPDDNVTQNKYYTLGFRTPNRKMQAVYGPQAVRTEAEGKLPLD